MWETIIGLFYRQACKASLYAIRSTRRKIAMASCLVPKPLVHNVS